jgi:hypothetical protein
MARNKIIEMVAELSRLTSRCEANAILILYVVSLGETLISFQ